MKKPSKLVLGTVQLGMEYGIANQGFKPSENESLQLLEEAWVSGITAFDTAPVYGCSEELIGKMVKAEAGRADRVTIITKTPVPLTAAERDRDPSDLMKEKVNLSLENMGIDSMDYYLLHDPKDIDNGSILKTMFALKEQGLIKEPGASVYSVEEAENAVKAGLRTLQVPANIFDRRFLKQSLLDQFSQDNVTLMVRSVFLQGLFFIEPELLSGHLKEADPYLRRLRELARQEGFSINELALKYIDSFTAVDHIIIGAVSGAQLISNLEALHGPVLPGSLLESLEDSFSAVPERLSDPRTWEG